MKLQNVFVSGFIALIFIVSFIDIAHATTDHWTTPGSYNWTCPQGINQITIYLVGGGGSGGNGGYSDYDNYETTFFFSGGGGGGGGSGYLYTNTISVTPGTTYSLTVGAGGSGSAGGQSKFSTYTANGGGRGNNGGNGDPYEWHGGYGGGGGAGRVAGGTGGNGQSTGYPGTVIGGSRGSAGTGYTFNSVVYGAGGQGGSGESRWSVSSGGVSARENGFAGSAGLVAIEYTLNVEVRLQTSLVEVTEGQVLQAYITRDVTSQVCSVNFYTQDFNAKAGQQFAGIDTVINFAVGESVKIINITTFNDGIYHQNGVSGFYGKLRNPVNCEIDPIHDTEVYLIYDLPSGNLSLQSASRQAEHDAGGVAIKVIRSGGTQGHVSCVLYTEDITAIAPTDYRNNVPGSFDILPSDKHARGVIVNFANGETEKEIFIDIWNTVPLGQQKTFHLGLSTPVNTTISGINSATVFVSNNYSGGQPARIWGMVKDSSTLSLISGADVQLLDSNGIVLGTDLTGPDGTFEFTFDVDSGQYSLFSQKLGYYNNGTVVTYPVDFVWDDEYDSWLCVAVVYLSSGAPTPTPVPGSHGRIWGMVKDTFNRTLLSGASVQLLDSNGNVLGTDLTGPDGTFEFTFDVDSGQYSLFSQKALYFKNGTVVTYPNDFIWDDEYDSWLCVAVVYLDYGNGTHIGGDDFNSTMGYFSDYTGYITGAGNPYQDDAGTGVDSVGDMISGVGSNTDTMISPLISTGVVSRLLSVLPWQFVALGALALISGFMLSALLGR